LFKDILTVQTKEVGIIPEKTTGLSLGGKRVEITILKSRKTFHTDVGGTLGLFEGQAETLSRLP
jgi:hypothetical protein